MATMNMDVWGLTAAPEIVGPRSQRHVPRSHPRWQGVGRILYAAALASAMTVPGIHALGLASELRAGDLDDGR